MTPCPQVTGADCVMQPNKTLAAQVFGNSEGNCATPVSLYTAAVDFIQTNLSDAALIYFTGDFAEAGASYPCHNGTSPDKESQQQILDIINYDWLTLRAAMPGVPILGSLGNHDSSPGDIFQDTEGQAWLYTNLTSLWGPDLGHDTDALASVTKGGYFAVRPAKTTHLTVISLNINYWCSFNKAAAPGQPAFKLGQDQFAFLDAQLTLAQSRGDSVHILGHEPAAEWMPGFWARYMSIVDKHAAVVKGQYFGHIHTDQWSVTRSCRKTTGREYTETTGIKWCSGGGDYAPGDVFQGGLDGVCPLLPPGTATAEAVTKCETVCTADSGCVGFTMYFNGSAPKECCFRTGSTSNKPVDPTSTARCYEKPGGVVCDGAANGVLIPAPSLTEGWPATNPAIRVLEFDETTHELLEMQTYTADLHAGNAKGALTWSLEYSFREYFGMEDLSPGSFEALATGLAKNSSASWDDYKGRGDGSLFCSRYTSETAEFTPIGPCSPCPDGSACKSQWIALLNGTDLSVPS